MNIVSAVILCTIVGAIGAVVLVLAAKFMAVEEDPRIEEVSACLAGANCGGCGYAGCADYAKAVVMDGVPCDKCAPGGPKAAAAIAKIMGGEASAVEKKAVVQCQGSSEHCKPAYDYKGIQTCAAAATLYGGPKTCSFACIGLGDCTKVCKFDAIHIVDGVAKVDKDVIYDDAHDGARSTDQVAATNQLTFAQGDVTYLSRADGFANYAEATAAPANHSLSAQALADYASAATFDAAKYDDPNAVMPTTGANNGLKLADLTGVAYDDPKWEQLLDELTVNDLFSLTADGGYHTVGVESIGLSATEDCDGPTGVHSNYNPAAGPSYPGTVMLACTWNQPLAKARGEQIAKECAEINCTGWYAPAMNIHRSAFGGRNFEYYSECGVLSGLTAAAEVSGATENGLICYVKHFAFNDQDNYRQNNICTWLNDSLPAKFTSRRLNSRSRQAAWAL